VLLSITKSGSGKGLVSSKPTGIACGKVCKKNFKRGARVTLTALPTSTSIFDTWGGACRKRGSKKTCTLTLQKGAHATAVFVKKSKKK
jgi:hypothetical protein